MKSIILILALALSSFTAVFSQDKEVVINLYTNFLYFNSNYNPSYFEFDRGPIDFFGLTPSISFFSEESEWIHEFEPRFWYQQRNQQTIKEFEAGLRYSIGRYLYRSEEDKIRIRAGLAARTAYYQADFTPTTANDFPVETRNTWFGLSLVGHVEFWITPTIKVDISTLNFSSGIGFDIEYTDDPALSENQKRKAGFNFNVGGQRIFRVGLGFEL